MTAEIHTFASQTWEEQAQHAQASPVGVDWKRQLAACIGTIVICTGAYVLWAQDFGNTGFAIFLLLVATVAAVTRCRSASSFGQMALTLAAGIGLFVACARLIWQPNPLVFLSGLFLVMMFTGCTQSTAPGPLRLLIWSIRSLLDGLIRWIELPWQQVALRSTGTRWPVLSIGVPLFVSILFLVPLLQSQPEIASRAYTELNRMLETVSAWAMDWNIVASMIVGMVGLWAMGLLMPFDWLKAPSYFSDELCVGRSTLPQGLYSAARNSLLMVGFVFVAFLVLEFRTMWFRSFPDGFRYAAYAHEGAAWLTFVLALSTITLSIIFQPSTHAHPCIKTLKALAAWWSVCNLLLVIAAFHRLAIYIQYNGLTRLRIIGLVGVACVFAGFAIVVWKIAFQRSFTWVVRMQAWAFLTSLFVLAVMPMDAIAHRWNEASVRRGYLPPIVQFGVQTISDEGWLCALPLIDHEDPIVRDGIRALLVEHQSNDVSKMPSNTEGHEENPWWAWTQFRGSSSLLSTRIGQFEDRFESWRVSRPQRLQAIEQFKAWSAKWY